VISYLFFIGLDFDRRLKLTVLDLVPSSYMTWIVSDSISFDLGTVGGFNYFDAVRFCFINLYNQT
jgi:hypothetical protein